MTESRTIVDAWDSRGDVTKPRHEWDPTILFIPGSANYHRVISDLKSRLPDLEPPSRQWTLEDMCHLSWHENLHWPDSGICPRGQCFFSDSELRELATLYETLQPFGY